MKVGSWELWRVNSFEYFDYTGFSGVQECPIGAFRLGPIVQCICSANASGGLATLDDGSTPSVLPSLLREALHDQRLLPAIRYLTPFKVEH